MVGNVAVKGDVVAEASDSTSNTALPNAEAGSWTAGSVVEKFYPKLTIDNIEVIYEASCVFTYSGIDKSSGSALPPHVHTVKLVATAKKLMSDSDFVLVDGDTDSDDDGNSLTVSTGSIFTTK